MRPTADPDPEHAILTTEAGLALLAEAAARPHPGPADLARWRKQAGGRADLVAAAVRIADGRRRAAGKFPHADRIWPEAVAVEQATAAPVARHKAARFAAARPDAAVDLCCGIGGDAIALAAAGIPVLAVDRDAGMTRRVRWNADVHGVGDRVQVIRSLAETFPIPPAAFLHVDPDRRSSGGGRARLVEDYVPSLDLLRSLTRTCRGGAIKLGPGSDFAETGLGAECEVISLGGECKEATAWFGELATEGVRIRATTLPAGATWTDRDGDPGRTARVADGPDAWVFDPDPALTRAGLLDGFAGAVGLARVGPAVDLLTGPDPVNSPWLAAFRVESVEPLDLKGLRRVVATRGLGPLEIKTRGVELRPEAVRAELRPPGPNPSTLILVAGRGVRSLAIVATRASRPG